MKQIRTLVFAFLVYAPLASGQSFSLDTWNAQFKFLLDSSGKKQTLTPEIKKQLKDILSGCLNQDRSSALTELVDEQFEAGNPGPAIGFLLQKFRISDVSAQLEQKFNSTCRDSQCRSQLMAELQKSVTDPRVFQLLFEAQYYPRVFYIENIPGVDVKPVTTPAQPPIRKKWMTDETYKALLADFEKNPPSQNTQSDSNDFLLSQNHTWRETNRPRTFPIANGFQNHGVLKQNGNPYFEYSFCDDDTEKSYSPNFWPYINGVRVGMKTYLGCHGLYNFWFPMNPEPNCRKGSQFCTADGKLPYEFQLSKEESSCFQRRLFNPNPSGRGSTLQQKVTPATEVQ